MQVGLLRVQVQRLHGEVLYRLLWLFTLPRCDGGPDVIACVDIVLRLA